MNTNNVAPLGTKSLTVTSPPCLDEPRNQEIGRVTNFDTFDAVCPIVIRQFMFIIMWLNEIHLNMKQTYLNSMSDSSEQAPDKTNGGKKCGRFVSNKQETPYQTQNN